MTTPRAKYLLILSVIGIAIVGCFGPAETRNQVAPTSASAVPGGTEQGLSVVRMLQSPGWVHARATLLTLNPLPEDARSDSATAVLQELFRGWRVLGVAPLSNQERQLCLNALLGQLTADPKAGLPCFEPRHGLRFERQSEILDLVICFECLRFRAYGAGVAESGCLESADGEAVFNKVALERGLALSRAR